MVSILLLLFLVNNGDVLFVYIISLRSFYIRPPHKRYNKSSINRYFKIISVYGPYLILELQSILIYKKEEISFSFWFNSKVSSLFLLMMNRLLESFFCYKQLIDWLMDNEKYSSNFVYCFHVGDPNFSSFFFRSCGYVFLVMHFYLILKRYNNLLKKFTSARGKWVENNHFWMHISRRGVYHLFTYMDYEL